MNYVKRPFPKSGPSSSDDYNSSIQELSVDLQNLFTFLNTEVYPVLASLPLGTDDRRWDLKDTLKPQSHGLHGAQMFMDNLASAARDDGRYWDSSNLRPKTLKEVATHLYTSIDTLEDTFSGKVEAISSGLTGAQWDRVGHWVRDGGTTHLPTTSLDGQIQELKGNVAAHDNEIDYMQIFMGKTGDGSETPTYSTHIPVGVGVTWQLNLLADTYSLEKAIGLLDAAHRLEVEFEDHTDVDIPIVINHQRGLRPIVQVLDLGALDYTGYEQDTPMFSDDFLNIVHEDDDTTWVYTSATRGVIICIF